MLPVINCHSLVPVLRLRYYATGLTFLSPLLILCFFTCHFPFSYLSRYTAFACPSFNISSYLPVTHLVSLCLYLFFCQSLQIFSSYLSITQSLNLHCSLSQFLLLPRLFLCFLHSWHCSHSVVLSWWYVLVFATFFDQSMFLCPTPRCASSANGSHTNHVKVAGVCAVSTKPRHATHKYKRNVSDIVSRSVPT